MSYEYTDEEKARLTEIKPSPPIIKSKFTQHEGLVLMEAMTILEKACGRVYDPREPANQFCGKEMANDCEPVATLLRQILKRHA